MHSKPPFFRGVCVPSLGFKKLALEIRPTVCVIYHPCDTVCRTKVSSRGGEDRRGDLCDEGNRDKELYPCRWPTVVVLL